MKDYIERLARGNFVFNEPEMILTDKTIEKKITVNTVNTYELIVSATSEIKGAVYSSCERVKAVSASFAGKAITIKYTVDVTGLESSDVIQGTFDIISNAGEGQISYVFKIVEEMCETSTGCAYNMFHFANLVQTAPDEAGKLFLSDRFSKVFVHADASLENLYDVLKGNSALVDGNIVNEYQVKYAVEEFLIAIRKKAPVSIKISEESRLYDDISDDINDKLVISRSGWGFLEIEISVDAPFVKLSHEKLTDEDFTGNKYELEYIIDKKLMHNGKNYARVTVETNVQKLYLDIEVIGNDGEQPVNQLVVERKKAVKKLTDEYLSFRMKRQNLNKWLEKSNKILEDIRNMDSESVYLKLVQAQMYLAGGRADAGIELLDMASKQLEAEDEIDIPESVSYAVDGVKDDIYVELRCYLLYVRSLALKSEEFTKKAVEKVMYFYENGHDNWRMLWMMFYLDAEQDNNKSIKLARIKDVFHKGCTSPIMYFEAMSILNAQPVLLRVLNDFELQVLNFGCKYKIISDKLAGHICDLISNEKVAGIKLLKLLESLNDVYANDEILTALVTHLIRNELIGERYFKLYEKGILRGLKITRLYEFYMLSIDRSQMKRLPKMVLMYFAYESQLDYASKAYLYANIITNGKEMPDILLSYDLQIEKFAYEQMRLNNIDENLVIIYKHVWNKNMLNDDTAGFMNRFLFTYKIRCYEDKISYVVVKHKELDVQEKYPLINNIAFVPMYTENCAVAFEQDNMVRRRGSIQYEIEKVFSDDKILPDVLSMCGNDILTQLYTYEQNVRHSVYDAEAYDVCMKLLENENINEDIKKDINSWLITYCHNSYEGDNFRNMYTIIDTDALDENDSMQLIECCIDNEMYEDAFDLIENYGYDRVNPASLFRLARKMIEIVADGYNEIIINICKFIFDCKKYDEITLNYMVEYYNGNNEQMYSVWKACSNFGVDNQKLAERIIAQMVFTGEHNGRLTEVFGTYYENGARDIIVEGYLAYNSYLFFVKHRKANDIVFRLLEERMLEEFRAPAMCKIALLKHYADISAGGLKEEQTKLAQSILNEMCDDNIFFEFFKKFRGLLNIPYNAVDKSVVEYNADSTDKVEIHYTYGNEGESYITETMKSQINSVFTKTFKLFYGETLQYYITCDHNGEIIETEKNSLSNDTINPESNDGRFDNINDMLASMELHDMATLKKLMHGYSVQSYVSQQLFKFWK